MDLLKENIFPQVSLTYDTQAQNVFLNDLKKQTNCNSKSIYKQNNISNHSYDLNQSWTSSRPVRFLKVNVEPTCRQSSLPVFGYQ